MPNCITHYITSARCFISLPDVSISIPLSLNRRKNQEPSACSSKIEEAVLLLTKKVSCTPHPTPNYMNITKMIMLDRFQVFNQSPLNKEFKTQKLFLLLYFVIVFVMLFFLFLLLFPFYDNTSPSSSLSSSLSFTVTVCPLLFYT